ncbi:MAG: CTP-dependent riboflavin kinase [Methanobacteriaceae archaeon]|nr:CTP-dependent riboflavin kinase [Methanobacteriaceae archaeon]
MTVLKGYVISGMNKASKFMEQKIYMDQFKEKIGFTPIPGTLNIKLTNGEYILNKTAINKLQEIKGDENHGNVYFLSALLKKEGSNKKKLGTILFPMKTQHKKDTIEFVADVYLRKTMNLHDNSKVILEIYD